MKTLLFIHFCGLALLVSVANSEAAITAYTSDFNSGDSSWNDVFKNFNGNSLNDFAWSGTAGVGNSGGILITNGIQNPAFYRPDDSSSFNLSTLTGGEGYRSTADFFWSGNPASSDLTVLTMGFTIDNSKVNALSTGGSLAGSLIRSANSTNLTLRIRYDNNVAAGSLNFPQATLSPGSWYRLQFDMVKASESTFNSIVTLYSIGVNGLVTPVAVTHNSSAVSISGTITAASLSADEEAHSAIDVRANGGITALDNLSVSYIPEPSSAGLVLLGVSGLIARRRRRI
jgi:hypothetical protein